MPTIVVGDACPLVRPYIWLSWMRTVMSGFLLVAWSRWLPPSAYMSPSPPSAMTVSSGFAAFRPVAIGIALPWSVW